MLRNVYLIRSTSPESEVFYKIGYTKKDVSTRLKQLQTGNPNKLDIICVYKSERATQIEAYLHKVYNNEHVHLEWFRLDDEQVCSFLVHCVKIHENLKILSTNTYWNKSYIPEDFTDTNDEYHIKNTNDDDEELWYM